MIEPWKRRLRMGMVGGGEGAFIGAVHRMAAAIDGQIELVAGSFSRDLNNTRRTGAALYLNSGRCYDDYRQMAAAEAVLPADQRIDFVTIVTPTVSHFEIAETFLRAGIHVMCDKPLTYSVAEAERLAVIAGEMGLVCGVMYNYTGYPMVRQARQLVQGGVIGDVRKVVVEYLQDYLVEARDDWRLDPSQVGIAGTLGEMGVHAFHLAEYMTSDRISGICADRKTFIPGRVLEEDASLLLRFAGGGSGVMTVSQIATGEDNNLNIRVYGSKGALAWAQEDPNQLQLYTYGKPRQTLTRGHAEYLGVAATGATRIPQGHPEGYLEAFAVIYAGFVDAVRRHIDGRGKAFDDGLFPTVSDGVRGLLLVAKAVESADAGSRWVAVNSTSTGDR